MAPELFSDAATHSMASDLWALGCMLYECSMGRPPFMNPSFNQLVHDILHAEPQPIPGARHDHAAQPSAASAAAAARAEPPAPSTVTAPV